jgi:ABC-type uncharacterized transport system substrate-binding protein
MIKSYRLGWVVAALFLAARAWAGEAVLVLSADSPDAQAITAAFKKTFPTAVIKNLEGNDQKQRQVGEELKAKPPAVAVVVGDLAGQMAKWYLEGVPVVYCGVPKAAKISLTTAPGVGIYFEPDPLEQLKSIRELFPDKTKIAVLYNPQSVKLAKPELEAAAKTAGVTLSLVAVDSIKTMPDQIKSTLPNCQLVWVFTDPDVFSPHSLQYLVLQSIALKVPIFCGNLELARGGATAALVPDPRDVGEKAAAEAKTVIDGQKPAAGTVRYPKGHLVLNQKTAAMLGVSFPAALLQSAEVIK